MSQFVHIVFSFSALPRCHVYCRTPCKRHERTCFCICRWFGRRSRASCIRGSQSVLGRQQDRGSCMPENATMVFCVLKGVGGSWQEIREVLSCTLAVDAASGLDSEAHPCPCHLLQLQLRPPPPTRCQHHEMSEHTTRKTPLIVA